MAQMTQKQVEDWIAANGGPSAVQYSPVDKKSIRNPEYDQVTNPLVPQYIDVDVESWKNSKTGATLAVRRSGPDSLEVMDNTGGDPSKPTTGQTSQIEGTPDASKSDGFDNERPVMVTRGADGKVIESRPLTPAEAKDWRDSRERSRNPGGKTDAENQTATEKAAADARQAKIDEQNAANVAADNKRADEAAAATRALQNKPTVTLTDDGKGGKVAVITTPDGKVSSQPVPGVQGTPPQVTVAGTVYERGADGKYSPAAGITNPNEFATEPGGAPPVGITPQEIAQGLETYSKWLNDQVNLYRSSGGKQGIEPTKASALMAQRYKIADAASSAYTAQQSAETSKRTQDLTQRSQDLTSDANKRTAVGNIVNNVDTTMNPQLKYLAPGKAGLFTAARDENIRNALAMAGLTQPPGQGGTFVDAARPAPPAPPPPPPAPMQPRPVTQPNALGLGAIGNTPAPGGAPAQGDPAAMEAARQQQAAAAAPPKPALPPSPPPAVNPVDQSAITVPASKPAGDQRNSADMDLPPGTPPAATPNPVNSSDMNLPPGTPPAQAPAPAVAPQPGDQANGLPPGQSVLPQPDATPTPPSPYPAGAGTMSLPQGQDLSTPMPAGNPDMGPVGMLPPGQQIPFLAEQRSGQQFDPHATAADIAQRLGISPDIMAQAVQGLYGQTWTPPGQPAGVAA